jgi:branched-chain amino acid transport system substrate-binding protein
MKTFALGLFLLIGLMSSAHADVTLGVYGPLTGPVASESDYWTVGIEQAVEDINARGGVLGQKIVVMLLDDACDPRQAVAVMNRMVATKIAAIIGASCSGSTMAAAPVADEAGIPQIVTVALNSAITDHGWTSVYRMSGRDSDHAQTAVDFLKSKAHAKKIAVLHDKSAFCKGLADLVKNGLSKDESAAVIDIEINAGDNDLTSTVAKLKAEKVDAVYLSLFMREGGLFARQAKEQGLKTTLVGASTLSLPEFRQIAGDAADGVFIIKQATLLPPASDIALRMRQRRPIVPNVFTHVSYAAVEALAQAIDQAKSDRPDAISKVLRSGHFSTIMGKVIFDTHGDFHPNVGVFRWQGNDVVPWPNTSDAH